MKIPVISNLDIHEFSGFGVTEYESGMTNVIAHEKNGTVRATQRASIDISEDSTGISALNNRGRGIYYWEQNSKLYIVHDSKIYANSQNNVAVGTISAGSERVQILETIGVIRMVILDSENNEGWIMTIGETVTQIASSFPASLVHGGQILDGYLFVMNEDGVIFNSAVDNPAIFPATGFVEAERENDKGVYLGKHHDNLVSFGTRTTEFFYDAANSVGSPLNRRQDISYNIGCVSGTGVWENGDKTYFVGSNPNGQLAIYKLESFQITQVSKDTFSSYLTEGITQNSLKIALEGVAMMSNDILIMTIYTLTGTPGEISPKASFSFDTKTGLWGFIHTEVNGHTTFPIMAGTKRTGGQNATVSARTWEGILSNGDIISMNDNLIPIDTLLGNTGVFDAGVFEAGVFLDQTTDSGVNIPVIMRTGLQDGGTLNYKFQSKESVAMESTGNAQTMTIKHSDEVAGSFDTGNTVDISLPRKEVWQGGRFIKRNYQLEFSGNEQIFVENIDVEVEVGL